MKKPLYSIPKKIKFKENDKGSTYGCKEFLFPHKWKLEISKSVESITLNDQPLNFHEFHSSDHCIPIPSPNSPSNSQTVHSYLHGSNPLHLSNGTSGSPSNSPIASHISSSYPSASHTLPISPFSPSSSNNYLHYSNPLNHSLPTNFAHPPSPPVPHNQFSSLTDSNSTLFIPENQLFIRFWNNFISHLEVFFLTLIYFP